MNFKNFLNEKVNARVVNSHFLANIVSEHIESLISGSMRDFKDYIKELRTVEIDNAMTGKVHASCRLGFDTNSKKVDRIYTPGSTTGDAKASDYSRKLEEFAEQVEFDLRESKFIKPDRVSIIRENEKMVELTFQFSFRNV